MRTCAHAMDAQIHASTCFHTGEGCHQVRHNTHRDQVIPPGDDIHARRYQYINKSINASHVLAQAQAYLDSHITHIHTQTHTYAKSLNVHTRMHKSTRTSSIHLRVCFCASKKEGYVQVYTNALRMQKNKNQCIHAKNGEHWRGDGGTSKGLISVSPLGTSDSHKPAKSNRHNDHPHTSNHLHFSCLATPLSPLLSSSLFFSPISPILTPMIIVLGSSAQQRIGRPHTVVRPVICHRPRGLRTHKHHNLRRERRGETIKAGGAGRQKREEGCMRYGRKSVERK